MKQLFSVLIFVMIIVIASCRKEISSSDEPIQTTAMRKFDKELPLKGVYITVSEILSGPPFVRQRITGIGQLSHLGQSKFVAISTVDFTTAPPFSLGGTSVFTAANGDEF